MKKLLSIFILLIIFPATAFGAIAAGWNATSTDRGFIAPTAINGNIPYIQIPYLVSTSSATSTFAGGVKSPCFSNDGITCLGSGSGGGSTGTVSTSTSETSGFLPYWTSTAATPALIGKVATTSLSVSSPLTLTGTLGALVGGSNSTVNCQTASGSQAGCLSSTDWTTFNNKQNTLANTIANGLTATTTFSNGGLVFADNTPKLTQDTANLNWNNTGKLLGIGVGSATTTQIQSGQSGVGPGTISNTASSLFVNGVGTQFFNNFKSGDTITVGAQTVTISLVNSNTNMQMSTAITSAHTGISYSVPTRQGFFVYGNGGLLNIGQVGIGNSASVEDTQNQFGIQGSLVIQNTITRDFQAYANNTGTNAYADIFTNTTYLPTGTSAADETFFGYDSQGKIDDASTVDIGAVIGARFSAIGGGSGQIGEVLGGLFEATDGNGINPIVTGGNFAVQGVGTDGVVTAGNFQTFLFSNSVDTSFGEQILLSTFGSTIGDATGLDISTMGDASTVVTGDYQAIDIHLPTGGSGLTVNGNAYGIISDPGSGNWGIGTTTPTAGLSLVTASSTVASTAYTGLVAIFAGMENTVTKIFASIDQWGGWIFSGDAPTLGTCGVSPSVASASNQATGNITVGTGIVTACAVKFAHPYPTGTTVHVFIETDGTTALANSVSAISTTGFTANFAASLGSGTFDYWVISSRI